MSLARHARVCVAYGLKNIKIKIDGDDARDRVAAVRKAVGPSVSLPVDANCAFTPDAAVETLEALAPLDIACAEQPIPRGDPEVLANVRSRSPIPIMADESLVTLADAEALIQAGACDFFNLRVSKCGGLARTLEIARMADRAGLQLQLGCQVGESAILSAAGRHVAAHLDRVSFVEGSYGNMMRDLGFLASEGHFTLPNQDNTASGILSLNGNYYEFIPETSLDDADPPVLSSHELESGVNYAVLLTTPGGLYRYDIHDIVQVTGFYRNAPLLAFIRKGRDMTSITGEKMHVNHLLLALEEVRRRFDVSVVEQFRVVARVEARRYEIYAELKGEFWRDFLLHEVIPHLDHALAGVNVEYAEKRGSRRLAPPCLHLMRPGWAEAEVLRAAGAGKRDIQYKWRILSDEPADEDADAILNTIETVEVG